MPRHRTQEEANHGPSEKKVQPLPPRPAHSVHSAPTAPLWDHLENGARCLDALGWFCTQSQGYLRIVPKDEGKAVYHKFKWTAGPLQGFYALVVDWGADPKGALALLKSKVELCEAGQLKAVRDTWNGPA